MMLASVSATKWPALLVAYPTELVIHKCISDASVNCYIFGSVNGLSPVWHQAITQAKTGLLLSRHTGINWSVFYLKHNLLNA